MSEINVRVDVIDSLFLGKKNNHTGLESYGGLEVTIGTGERWQIGSRRQWRRRIAWDWTVLETHTDRWLLLLLLLWLLLWLLLELLLQLLLDRLLLLHHLLLLLLLLLRTILHHHHSSLSAKKKVEKN
jgi:hypothetical protein